MKWNSSFLRDIWDSGTRRERCCIWMLYIHENKCESVTSVFSCLLADIRRGDDFANLMYLEAHDYIGDLQVFCFLFESGLLADRLETWAKYTRFAKM